MLIYPDMRGQGCYLHERDVHCGSTSQDMQTPGGRGERERDVMSSKLEIGMQEMSQQSVHCGSEFLSRRWMTDMTL